MQLSRKLLAISRDNFHEHSTAREVRLSSNPHIPSRSQFLEFFAHSENAQHKKHILKDHLESTASWQGPLRLQSTMSSASMLRGCCTMLGSFKVRFVSKVQIQLLTSNAVDNI